MRWPFSITARDGMLCVRILWLEMVIFYRLGTAADKVAEMNKWLNPPPPAVGKWPPPPRPGPDDSPEAARRRLGIAERER